MHLEKINRDFESFYVICSFTHLSLVTFINLFLDSNKRVTINRKYNNNRTVYKSQSIVCIRGSKSIDFHRRKGKGEKKKVSEQFASFHFLFSTSWSRRQTRVNAARFSLIESKLQEGRTGPTLGGIFEQSHSKWVLNLHSAANLQQLACII